MINFRYDAQHELTAMVLNAHRDKLAEAKEAMNQTMGILIEQGFVIDDISELGNESNWYELKNYNWIAYREKGEFDMLVRHYGRHMTVYFNDKKKEYYHIWGDGFKAATIYINDELIKEDGLHDELIDNPFQDLLPALEHVVKKYRENVFHIIWAYNDPEYMKLKCVLNRESVHLDQFGFILEELASVNHCAMVDYNFKEFCRKYVGMKFRIPTYGSSSVFYTHIEENDEGDLHFIRSNGEYAHNLDTVFRWSFDRVSKFLAYSGYYDWDNDAFDIL